MKYRDAICPFSIYRAQELRFWRAGTSEGVDFASPLIPLPPISPYFSPYHSIFILWRDNKRCLEAWPKVSFDMIILSCIIVAKVRMCSDAKPGPLGDNMCRKNQFFPLFFTKNPSCSNVVPSLQQNIWRRSQTCFDQPRHFSPYIVAWPRKMSIGVTKGIFWWAHFILYYCGYRTRELWCETASSRR